MLLYLVAKSRHMNGHFDVHESTCPFAPPPPHRHYLGSFFTPNRAVEDARRLYPRSEACSHCCSPASNSASVGRQTMQAIQPSA